MSSESAETRGNGKAREVRSPISFFARYLAEAEKTDEDHRRIITNLVLYQAT